MMSNLLRLPAIILALAILFCGAFVTARAQAQNGPLTNQEFVSLLYQLPKNPGLRDQIISEIRRRGINFELTTGLRSLIATKSGNDQVLRRTLEEAERRRLNPTGATLPPEAESSALLEKARAATLAASEAMPDFIVKQLVTRSMALGKTQNWRVLDHLSYAVSYRASAGEEYKLLAINGQIPGDGVVSREQLGGSTSAGEFVSMLAKTFSAESQAQFRAIDTDTLRGRRTIVYEYEVKKQFSTLHLKAENRAVTAGYRGRVWIDRENNRVLRLEEITTDAPEDFPIADAQWLIDYDWVTIAEQQYLLPVQSDVIASIRTPQQAYQNRNEIRFRNYQKYGSEVKIIEDFEPGEEEESPEKKP
jgi:hypothetical protein